MITISKQYSFDAAHQLYDHNESEEWNQNTFGKCAQLHGHTYNLEVEVTGNVSEDTGMVLNYFDLDEIVKPIVESLDHKNLNDVFSGLTTAERMVAEIATQIRKAILAKFPDIWIELTKITLQETPKTKAVWHNPHVTERR